MNIPAYSTLIVSVISSLIGAILGLAFKRIYSFVTVTRPIRKIWNRLLFPSRKLLVGLTSLETTPIEGNRAVTTFSEASALANILGSLKHHYKDLEVELYSSDKFPSMKLGGNILLSGGPRNNKITRIILDRFDLPFRYEEHDLIIRIEKDQKFCPVVVDNAVVRDYGLISVLRNPFDEHYYLYMLTGCYAYGVNAAIRCMTWPNVKTLASKIKSDEFMIIVEADVVDEYVSLPHIVGIYTIRRESPVGDNTHRRLILSKDT